MLFESIKYKKKTEKNFFEEIYLYIFSFFLNKKFPFIQTFSILEWLYKNNFHFLIFSII
jgi:hypothetical protein